ncbi:hypothetical protein BC332_02596 [Capsicum chinense]|nr:hypothetical protein BC332_02596 [Capsicum chinense]
MQMKKDIHLDLFLGLKYRIDKVPPHSLYMGSLCNRNFGEEIKKYFGEDVLGAFRNTIFRIFLDLPQCNWIGQILKCLLVLEIQQDNKDELHVWVQGKILKFTIFEFAIITDLKCTSNIDDYIYASSSKSALISKYFFDNKRAITRSKLITRVKMGNFDNSEDALNLTILFFVYTFMFSQHKKAPISVAHFQMVEDGRYIHFPWGKSTFEKLMNSWRQGFNIAKQLYSLGGMPQALIIWMFECYLVVRQRNVIPRILNWSVECTRPTYESFMSDFETFDPTTSASTSVAGTLKRTIDGFQQCVGTIAEEFGDLRTIPPRKILIKAGLASPISPDQPLKRRKTMMFHLYRETQKDAADKGEIDGIEFEHHQQGEIGVSTEHHGHKSVPSSSTQPEGTSMSSLDGDEIKNYINKCEEKIVDQQQSQLCCCLTLMKCSNISFDVDYVRNIPQQASDSLDRGVFVCAYAEILSEGQQVHSCGFDTASQRVRCASLLWHYGVEKANKGYTSDNSDPPWPRNSVIEEIDASAIVTLE